MGIRSSLSNAKYEFRFLLYGAGGPLLQKLYLGGFNSLDNGTLDSLLGQSSQLPGLAATVGALVASYKAGKAIDGEWPKFLRGSVQTMAYTGLILGAMKAGASLDSHSQPIDYMKTIIENFKTTSSCLSQGKMAPMMYTLLYTGLVSGLVRWTSNIGSLAVQIFTGEPAKDYKNNKK
jgi:hypothetical protein